MAEGRSLSSGTMQLKFMQRRREAELREKLEAERLREKETQWGAATKRGLVTEVDLRNPHIHLLVGRRSYGNFNPAFEVKKPGNTARREKTDEEKGAQEWERRRSEYVESDSRGEGTISRKRRLAGTQPDPDAFLKPIVEKQAERREQYAVKSSQMEEALDGIVNTSGLAKKKRKSGNKNKSG